jgi:type II secretory pathway pseudopilin PulG
MDTNKHESRQASGDGPSRERARNCGGFSMVEACVCIAVFGIIFAAFFSGLSSSFSMVGSARETLRATQIMAEKLDTLRLYSWDNLTTPGYVPTNFTAAFYPTNGLNAGTSASQGVTYTGTIIISNAPITTEDYAADVRTIVINLTWQRGLITRHAQTSTLFSRYGMQNYSIF